MTSEQKFFHSQQGNEAIGTQLTIYGRGVLKPDDENIKRTLKLVKAMLKLADDGDANRQDVGCGVLYGIVRDAGYKIKKAAEAEEQAHEKRSRRR